MTQLSQLLKAYTRDAVNYFGRPHSRAAPHLVDSISIFVTTQNPYTDWLLDSIDAHARSLRLESSCAKCQNWLIQIPHWPSTFAFCEGWLPGVSWNLSLVREIAQHRHKVRAVVGWNDLIGLPLGVVLVTYDKRYAASRVDGIWHGSRGTKLGKQTTLPVKLVRTDNTFALFSCRIPRFCLNYHLPHRRHIAISRETTTRTGSDYFWTLLYGVAFNNLFTIISLLFSIEAYNRQSSVSAAAIAECGRGVNKVSWNICHFAVIIIVGNRFCIFSYDFSGDMVALGTGGGRRGENMSRRVKSWGKEKWCLFYGASSSQLRIDPW